MELIVIDTKWLNTKPRNFEIVHETRLHPYLLTDWHDALVGISPRMTQPITTNRHRRHGSSGHFSCLQYIPSLSHWQWRGNFLRVIPRITRDLLLLKRCCFLFQEKL